MAEASGEHVVRGGKEGGLNKYDYESAGEGPLFDGYWTTLAHNAGAVGATGEGGDHWASAMHQGNYGHPQPGDQT